MREKIIKGFAVIKDFFGNDAGTHASSSAFFFFMAFIPMIIIHASVVPLLGIGAEDVIALLDTVAPDAGGDLISSAISEAYSNSALALSVSVIFLLIISLRGMKSLIKGLNEMYKVEEERRFAALNGTALANVALLILFLTLIIYLIIGGRVFEPLQWIFPGMRIQSAFVVYINFLSLLAAGTFFFALEYMILPCGRRSYAAQLPGAFLASAGWFVLIIGFRIYISYFNGITKFYGSLASVALFLFWLYCIFLIFLAGAYVNSHIGSFFSVHIRAFYKDHKKMAILCVVLVIIGLMAFLSNGFIVWKVPHASFARAAVIACRLITWFTWGTAAYTVFKCRRMRPPVTAAVFVAVIAIMDLFVIRRRMFPSVLIYLLVMSLMYLAAFITLAAAVSSE